MPGVSWLWAGAAGPAGGIPRERGQHRSVYVGSLSGVVLEVIF